MNCVSLVGNLAKDPELRSTQSGLSCCNFTVTVSRRFANQQGQREADFINCVAWRQTAEFVHKYFIKGNKIGLTGSLQTRSYDAQDGSKRFVTEVLVDNVEFVAPRGDTPSFGSQASTMAQNSGQHYAQPQSKPEQMKIDTNGFTEVEDDELPF